MHKDAAAIMATRHLTSIHGFGTGAQLSDRQLAKLASVNPGTVVRTMAKRAALLPFESFVAWFSGQPIATIVKDASYRVALDDLHNGRLKDACAQMCEIENDLLAGGTADGDPVDDVLDEMDGGLAVKVEGGVKPITTSCESKIAHVQATQYAAAYGVYKAAALREMMDRGVLTDVDATVVALRF